MEDPRVIQMWPFCAMEFIYLLPLYVYQPPVFLPKNHSEVTGKHVTLSWLITPCQLYAATKAVRAFMKGGGVLKHWRIMCRNMHGKFVFIFIIYC